jgi:hypothetical protein
MIGITAEQARAEHGEEHRRRQVPGNRQDGAGESELASRPAIEGYRVDEAKARDAIRIPNGDRLRHATADVVADDARLIDAKRVE